ncbi:cholinesterase-like [Diadema setosum]|uniref:cholinesterase-like n=1 Tax=Diadema setosum TaxID=31175 RepID=UPI003B3A2F3D
MVWIHGGGFSEGTAMSYAYNGIPLVGTGGGDVIVVTINYRLGIFATFTTKDEAAPGNYGMLDQVAALKWIYNNIGAFGGDRNRITLFGESAGGASVGFHLLSKLSRGYFNQAIMQSGSPLATWAFIDSREYEVQKIEGLAEVVGCEAEDSSALVECLREIDGSELRQAAEAIYVSHYVTLDGTFLEDTPVNLLTRGDLKRAAVLSGYTADEGTFFSLFADYPTPPVSLETFRQYVKDGLTLYEITNEFLHNAVLQEYTDWTVADDPEGDQWRSGIDFMGDTHFACPAEAMHKAHAAFGDAVFTYYMTFVPTKSIYSLGGLEVPSWFGAGHADDIPLVFGWVFTPEMRIYAGFNVTEAEAALSAKVMKFWTNFAKSGDPSRSSFDAPSGEGQDSWPVFTVPELRYKELSYELGEGRALNARRCSFWNQYFANLLTTAPEGGAESSEALHEWEESFEDWKDVVSDWKKLFAKYKQRQCN